MIYERTIIKRGLSFALVLAMIVLASFGAFAYDAKDVAIKVACVGDSITYGATIKNRATDSYPMQLQAMLGDGYDVENFGVNSYCVLKTSDKPYWDHPNFKRSADFNPDIVLIMLGTNDSKPYNWEKGKADLEKTYLQMIEYYKTLPSKPKVYVMIPPAAFAEGKYDIPPSVVVGEIVPRITKMAKDNKIPFIDIYNATKDMPERFSDTIHPDKEGAGVIAKTVFEALPVQSEIRAQMTSVVSHLDLGAWSVNSIDGLFQKGMLDAHIFSKYTRDITRDEVAMLTVRHVDRLNAVESSNAFKDIGDSKYVKEINNAYSLGIIKGKGDGIFDPAGKITREEMAVVIVNLLRLKKDAIPENTIVFSDKTEISDWALDAVSLVYQSGIMKGTGDAVFSPKGKVTREQALVILDRILNLNK